MLNVSVSEHVDLFSHVYFDRSKKNKKLFHCFKLLTVISMRCHCSQKFLCVFFSVFLSHFLSFKKWTGTNHETRTKQFFATVVLTESGKGWRIRLHAGCRGWNSKWWPCGDWSGSFFLSWDSFYASLTMDFTQLVLIALIVFKSKCHLAGKFGMA